MSLRLTRSSSQYASITSGVLSANGNYTICGWVYFATVASINQHIVNLKAEVSGTYTWQNQEALELVSGVLTLESINGGNASSDTGTTLTNGTWYHLALRRSGTTVDILLEGVVDCTVTRDATGRPATDHLYLGVYQPGGSPTDHADARFDDWRAWTAALSDAQIVAEAASATPVVTANLYAEWPFTADANRAVDVSANSNDWTESGSPTNEADYSGYPAAGAELTGAVTAPAAVCAIAGNITHELVSAAIAPVAVMAATAVSSDRIPMARWKSAPGIRRTSGSEKIRCLVDAYCYGGVSKVTFSVSVNGGAATDHDVTAPARWQPDDTTYTDPIGTATSGPASLDWWGYELDMATLAQGTIDVTPTVHPANGQALVMPTHRHINNKTSDTRPSSAVVYMSPSGDDANGGTGTGDAVKSRQRAIQLCAVSSDAGGGTVLMAAGTYDEDYVSGGATNVYCSDGFWVTFEPDYANGVANGDVVWTGTQTSGNWLRSSHATERLRIRVRDVTFNAKVVIEQSGSPRPFTWVEHCLAEPPAPWNTGSAPWVAAYGASPAQFFGFNGTDDGAETIITSSTRSHLCEHTEVGSNERGNLWTYCAGVAVNAFTGVGPVEVNNQLQYLGLPGYFTQITGGTHWTVQNNGSGRMRIISDGVPDPVYQFAADLVGGPVMGIHTQGFTSAGNNGNFAVLAGGADDGSGNQYFDLDNASFVAEAGGASAAVYPARVSDGTGFETLIHSDMCFHYGSGENGILHGVRTTGQHQCRGLVFNGGSFTRAAIVDCGPFDATNDIFDGTGWSHDHILILHCSFKAHAGFYSSNGYNDVEIANCVFDDIEPLGGTVGEFEGKVDAHHNHFTQAGQAFGTSNTTGSPSFAQADPQVSGDSTLDSGSGAVGSAAAILTIPSPWDTGDKGAYSGVLTGDWWPGVVVSADLTCAVIAPAAVMAAAGNITHVATIAAVAPAATMSTRTGGSSSGQFILLLVAF